MNRFQKMRKVCKGYSENPTTTYTKLSMGADWLREKS